MYYMYLYVYGMVFTTEGLKCIYVTLSIYISVFFSYTKKSLPLNILKFSKGKFSQMRW